MVPVSFDAKGIFFSSGLGLDVDRRGDLTAISEDEGISAIVMEINDVPQVEQGNILEREFWQLDQNLEAG